MSADDYDVMRPMTEAELRRWTAGYNRVVTILPTLAPPLAPAERNVLASLDGDLRMAHESRATWQVRAALVEGAAVVLAALAGEGAS